MERREPIDLIAIGQSRVFPYRRGYQTVKRVLDVTLCLLVLPVVLPLMAICALAIRLDSSGPVLFVQERIGKGGRRFRMYKFRTMYYRFDDSFHRAFMKAYVEGQLGGEDSDFRRVFVSTAGKMSTAGNIYRPVQVSQISRVGRILRKTSLDELPQIFNVLQGEMSLVGPRPGVLWEVDQYRPWHWERLEVLPGITGLAQVRSRSAISFDSIVQYDIEYVERQSLALDLEILWRSILSMIFGSSNC